VTVELNEVGWRGILGCDLHGAAVSIVQALLADPCVPVDWTPPEDVHFAATEYRFKRLYDTGGRLLRETLPDGSVLDWRYGDQAQLTTIA
jgi:YD repeat-containing protein